MLASTLPQYYFCGWEVGPTVRLPVRIARRGFQVCSGLRASSRVSLPTLLKDSVPSSLLITHQQLSRIDGFGSILLQDGWVLFCTRGENELLVLGMLQGLSMVYPLVQLSPVPWQIWLCGQRQVPGLQCGCFCTQGIHCSIQPSLPFHGNGRCFRQPEKASLPLGGHCLRLSVRFLQKDRTIENIS